MAVWPHCMTKDRFNWIPFRMHITHTLIGLGDILTGLWPFVSLCYIAMRTMRNRSNWVGIVGGFIVFLVLFTLEWRQQYVPGRYADITDAILAWLAWVTAWYFPRPTNASADNQISDVGFNSQVPDSKNNEANTGQL